MKFVDEDDDVARLDYLGDDCLETLLEVTAKSCARNDARQVKLDEAEVAQGVRNIARHDRAGQTLNNRGLSDPSLANQNGVVLLLPEKDLGEPFELDLTSDERVELARPRHLGQVTSILAQKGGFIFLRLAPTSPALTVTRTFACPSGGRTPRSRVCPGLRINR